MRFDELNENNYMLFAIKFYDNPHALTKEEFEDVWPAIKSFLMFLRRIPEYPKSHIHGIPEDQTCIDELNSV
jgi:hypothetical protein